MTDAIGDAQYFLHGLPGSPEDASLMAGAEGSAPLIAPDYLAALGKGDPKQAVLAQFDRLIADSEAAQVTVTGFSLGAMPALWIAAERADKVALLRLISPAAPLSLGDFLPDMAGRMVFSLATRPPVALAALTRLQGLLLRLAPGRLLAMLFSTSGAEERALLADPALSPVILQGMRRCFLDHPAAYRAMLHLYIRDWSDRLDQVRCPVQIRHGAEDAWAPPAMAQALEARLGPRATCAIEPGAGHYGTLLATAFRS